MPDFERLKLINEQANRTAVRQPPRRPDSVRRTSSIQSLWDDGNYKTCHMVGRATDIETDRDGRPRIIAEDGIEAEARPDRRLMSITGSRHREILARFAGLSAGGDLRNAMAKDLADDVADRSCLFRLLDDLAGAALMSVAAWYSWKGGAREYARRAETMSPVDRQVAGACLSYVPGSISMKEDGRGQEEISAQSDGPLPFSLEDPDGFHALVENDGPNEWRLRRTDIWMEGDGEIVADCWFQDSAAIFGATDRRRIFHEYSMLARIEGSSMTLASVEVTPHVLPYMTCRASVTTPNVLLNRNINDFRSLVPALLGRTAGCTHLNDMLRALPDAAALSRNLRDMS